MVYFIAQCLDNGFCFAVIRTHEDLEAPNNQIFVRIDSEDRSCLGKTWNGTAWVETTKT